ncbi:MAG: UbiA family prenyltransferase [Chloroflexi bacterium]|nr:UbiA family prenyltransferase [Chloroflexota bacterium]
MEKTLATTVISRPAVMDYLEVLKPLPSLLLTFIALAAAVAAGLELASPHLWLILAAVLVASSGANGLTNYLDRDLDARMKRTGHRALAARRIDPPEKALPLIGLLIGAGLLLSWTLGFFVFMADLLGTFVAGTWRKKVTCVYPQGVIASCAPVLMGWFGAGGQFSLDLLLVCLMVALWLPLHVWSLVITHRDDYLGAGLTYFPISYPVRGAVKVLLAFALALYASSMALYFVGDFGRLYLVIANLMGFLMLLSTTRLALSRAAADAWRLYRMSAFPYLAVVFLAMAVDRWLGP